MGVFAPGFKSTADYFMGMFKDIEANPARWGCKLPSPLPLQKTFYRKNQRLTARRH